MFDDDVETKKKPVWGYRLLFLSIIMIVSLTYFAISDMEHMEKDIIDVQDVQ